MAKPTSKPDWALTSQVDPTSNLPNYSEPPTVLKTYGFPFKALIPRQWINWLFRVLNQWVDWFEAQFDALVLPAGVSYSATIAGADIDFNTPGGLASTAGRGVPMPFAGTVVGLYLNGTGGSGSDTTNIGLTFAAGDMLQVKGVWGGATSEVRVYKNGTYNSGTNPHVAGVADGGTYATIAVLYDRQPE